jgi:hypothetical protein
LDAVVEFTEGYPYFLQEYGKALWDQVEESPFTADDVALAAGAVEAKLDGGFFRVRAERTSELERHYLRAMAEQVAPIRARLIEKGLLYTSGHGLAACTVPQFDRFMRRTYVLQ